MAMKVSFHGSGAKFFFSIVKRHPERLSLESWAVHLLDSTASHQQMNALFFKNLDYTLENDCIRYGATSSNMKWRNLMFSFHAGLLTFIYLTVNSSVFYCGEKTQVLQLTQEWG